MVLRLQPVEPHVHLQGHVDAGAGGKYFADLRDPDMATALALVHSRFSTNTFPSWDRAHPYRYIAHNGEINTLRGNINWMHAAQANFKSGAFRRRHQENPARHQYRRQRLRDVRQLRRIARHGGPRIAARDDDDDSRTVGKSREHEPGEAARFTNIIRCLMEPWDGPASIAFTDGIRIGACLDRNGLRPSRYYVTKDDLVIMASEAGVLPIAPERVLQKGRLQPGRMFLVDTEQGRIVADEELKKQIRQPSIRISEWLEQASCAAGRTCRSRAQHTRARSRHRCCSGNRRSATRSRTCASSSARWRNDGVQPLGSMGTDTPLAVLSNKPQLLYNYFKQLFAQVTNPPIDPIREEIITSTETMVGSRGGLLNPDTGKLRARSSSKQPDPHQRGIGKASARSTVPASKPRRCRSCSRPRKARRAWNGAGQIICRRRRSHRRRRQHFDSVRPRHRP